MSRKLTIEKMQEVAKERGGKCLSVEYNNNKKNLKWECFYGHTWGASYDSIQRGTWCPFCARNVKLTIEEMQEVARQRGGKCLSDKYLTARSKLKWQCSEGHIWEAKPDEIKNHGHWCPFCARVVSPTIDEIKKLAIEKGGLLLSDVYENAKSKLKWQCSKGHVWEANFDSISRDISWCPYCSQRAPLTIEEMQKIAEKRGGKCLSVKCRGSKEKLKWQCSEGHIWESTPDCIKNGNRWCPYCCKSSISEEICRRFFESIFKCKFNKTRPDWLIGIKGRKLELDGLSNIKFGDKYLAFEHDGYQHYYPSIFFNGTNADEKFETLKANDAVKNKLCFENNVVLFRIPSLFLMTKINDLKQLIVNIAVANGINFDVADSIAVGLAHIKLKSSPAKKKASKKKS